MDTTLPPMPTSLIPKTHSLGPDDLQRKMDELTRQIEAQKMEIVGILTKSAQPESMVS